jgi:hypothetical protein
MIKQNQTVAKAVRIEHNPDSGAIYLVFEIVDEDFKNRIKKDWLEDIDLKLIGKDLIEEK